MHMNQKHIGVILIIVGVVMAGFVLVVKTNEDQNIRLLVNEQGSCFLDDGTCLHDDRDYTMYLFGWALSIALIIFGVYISVFDKTQEVLAEHQVKVSSALKEAKQKDEFHAFLSGFTDEEKSILKAVKEQDGIKQSTLRYKTGISKSTLSLILKELEEKDIIKRKPAGKTNEVYLRKKF